MQAELIAINENKTVQDAVDYIREKYEEVGEIHNVFVTNDASQLVGVVPLKKLILAKGGTLMKDIEDRCITFATPEMDQEEVSQLFKKYDVVTLPVVNRQMQILGRIVVDDVIDVIEQEVSEDIFRMSGMSEEEDIVYSATPIKICMTRLPWLMFNFFGTLVSGYFLYMYQSRLQDLLALLAFVPVICAMSGNIGVQSTSIVIRGLATGRVDFSNLGRTIGKECIVGCIIGIVCGVVGGLVGVIWQSRVVLGLIVFLSMFIAIFFGAFMGVVVPLLFKKIKIDPAVASGALITTANDLVAINVYFLLAAVLTKAFIS
jgi:magnesium transporter